MVSTVVEVATTTSEGEAAVVAVVAISWVAAEEDLDEGGQMWRLY